VTPTPNGIVLSGAVANNDTAEKVAAAAQRYAGEKDVVVNNLEVAGPAQVNLRVRVAEVQRSITKQLGFNWEGIANPGSFVFGLATGRTLAVSAANRSIAGLAGLLGDRALALSQQTSAPNLGLAGVHTSRVNINNVIDALAEEGLVTILAQPNLTAISGQTASFLAGGEFPIPVAQNNTGGLGNTITIEFKPFGVRLDFIPTVLSTDRIAIKVRPEVSELSTRGAIRIGELEIPAISVRRAETTIRLGSGESFAIAGLIQDNIDTNISKFPWLGDLPIIGTLFRSSRFQRQETELVIIVTPYVVRPVPEGPSLRLPTDRLQPASDIERVVLDRLVRPSAAVTNPADVGAHLRGDAGFIFD
jgi:pilus assembly protein CpaC